MSEIEVKEIRISLQVNEHNLNLSLEDLKELYQTLSEFIENYKEPITEYEVKRNELKDRESLK